MLKKCLASLVMIGLLAGAALAAEDFPYEQEEIGELHLGLSETALKKIVPAKPARGEDALMGADDLYHQEWKYPAEGLELDMTSEKKGGTKTIASITVTSPSKLKTQRGIGIGSSEEQVSEAYGRFRNARDSEQFGGFVAGSIFGGAMFGFEQGKVSGIFIGAGAE